MKILPGAIIFAVLMLCISESQACTSCIVNMDRLILWKHRDTGAPYNFIARHIPTDSTFEYIALHNYGDTLGMEAWIGMNRAGFAVMNTASYNLAPDTARLKNREGFVMTAALKRCRSVDDFASLLDSLQRPIGVQANFGVIDAYGNAAYFETCDTGYVRYNTPRNTTTIRTNYSHSGGSEKRLGFMREKTARHFLDGKADVTPRYLTDTLSCSFYDAASGKDLCGQSDITDLGNLIPRYISTASIAIEANPADCGDGSNYVMWVRLGYPPGSKTIPVTFDLIPSQVMPDTDGITPAERFAEKVKQQIYHKSQGKKHIIDTTKLP